MRYPLDALALILLLAASACDGRTPNEPDWNGFPSLSRTDGTPTISAVASSHTQIDITWQPSGVQLSGYQLFLVPTVGAPSLLATTAPSTTTYSHGGLTPSTDYCYEVRSYRVSGRNTTYSGYSTVACAKTLQPPVPPPPAVAAPSGVDAKLYRNEFWVSTAATVGITWTDNSSNEDGFRVESSSTLTGPWTALWTTAPNATALGWSASREQTTCFRVIATSQSLGSSNPSTADCVTPPALVTNVVANTAAGSSSIDLTWSDNSQYEDGYAIVRSNGAGDSTIVTVPPNTTTYHDGTVTLDVTYTYRVLAIKEGVYSDDSNLASAVLATFVPAAPTGASSTTYSDDYGWLHLDIVWSDNSTNEEGFRIETMANSPSGWATYATVPPNTPGYGERFDAFSYFYVGGCFRVVAFNSRGDSAPSNVTCTDQAASGTNVTTNSLDAHRVKVTRAAMRARVRNIR